MLVAARGYLALRYTNDEGVVDLPEESAAVNLQLLSNGPTRCRWGLNRPGAVPYRGFRLRPVAIVGLPLPDRAASIGDGLNVNVPLGWSRPGDDNGVGGGIHRQMGGLPTPWPTYGFIPGSSSNEPRCPSV